MWTTVSRFWNKYPILLVILKFFLYKWPHEAYGFDLCISLVSIFGGSEKWASDALSAGAQSWQLTGTSNQGQLPCLEESHFRKERFKMNGHFCSD